MKDKGQEVSAEPKACLASPLGHLPWSFRTCEEKPQLILKKYLGALDHLPIPWAPGLLPSGEWR